MAAAFRSIAQLERRLQTLERVLGLDEDDPFTEAADGEEGAGRKNEDHALSAPPDDDAGVPGSRTSDATTTNALQKLDLVTRLDRIERSWHTRLVSQQLQSTHTDWVESLVRVEELDPGTALTRQSQHVAAPLLYRRQELLVQSDSLRECLTQLSRITSLLLVGQTPPTPGPSSTSGPRSQGPTPPKTRVAAPSPAITESQVCHAPILVESRITKDQIDRLAVLASQALQLQQRSDTATMKLDRVLHRYQALITSISERTVALDAALTERGV